MAKHWTQTAEGRKRMSAIGKQRHAAKKTVTSIPLDSIPERPQRKGKRIKAPSPQRSTSNVVVARELIKLALSLLD